MTNALYKFYDTAVNGSKSNAIILSAVCVFCPLVALFREQQRLQLKSDL